MTTAVGDAVRASVFLSYTCAHGGGDFPLSGFCGGGLGFLAIEGVGHFQVNHYPNSLKSNDRMTPIIPLRMEGKETKIPLFFWLLDILSPTSTLT